MSYSDSDLSSIEDDKKYSQPGLKLNSIDPADGESEIEEVGLDDLDDDSDVEEDADNEGFEEDDEEDEDDDEDELVPGYNSLGTKQTRLKLSVRKPKTVETEDEYSSEPGARRTSKRNSSRPAPPDLRPKRSRLQKVNYNEFQEQESGSSEVLNNPPPVEYEEEFEGYSSGTPDLTKMTERQRWKYLEENNAESAEDAVVLTVSQSSGKAKNFLSLSNDIKKKKVLTEEETQLRRLEMARRRKNLNERKLKEEKQDTLNKLLKKRAKKVRDWKSLSNDETESEQSARSKRRRPVVEHKGFFRWVSTKKEFRLGIPVLQSETTSPK